MPAKALRFLAPVQLESILQGLLPPNSAAWLAVQDQIDGACQRARKRLSSTTTSGTNNVDVQVRAWTHFTHFDILNTKVDCLSPKYLWYCWKRGVAIQIAHPQHGIDGIIPVFVGDLEHPFEQMVSRESHLPATAMRRPRVK